LRVAHSISEARAYLDGAGPFRDRNHNPIPNLIVSDMNLSGQTGNEFLEWVQKETRLSSIPFVFFSGSFRPSDQAKSTELGAGAFFVKTGDIAQMRDRVRSMLKFLPNNFGS
jgi:CheY-like chemotaxis protein